MYKVVFLGYLNPCVLDTCCIYNHSRKNKRMMFWCTYNHKIIEYGVSSLQRKKQGPEHYVINPRSHNPRSHCLLFSCPVNALFMSAEDPARTMPSGHLHQLHPQWFLVPCPSNTIFTSICVSLDYWKPLSAFFFRSLSLWTGKVTIFHSLTEICFPECLPSCCQNNVMFKF